MSELRTSGAAAPPFTVTASRYLGAWLAESGVSLAFTTYAAGKVFLIGLQPDGRLAIVERTFNRAMGLWASPDGRTLLLGTLHQLWRFEDALEPGRETPSGHDRLYVPQVAWTTGDVDIHDIGMDGQGRPLFVATLFSCLATVSETQSFVPLWRPAFVSRLAPEDRCHVNGLAMRDGRPTHLTAISASDVADGWRDARARGGGGVVLDVAIAEPVAGGLSMPHSPRWRGDRLWLLESGTGFLGHAELATGRFERTTFCPGYARGLALHGRWAVVGLSRPRESGTFQGLPLDQELARHRVEPRCGLLVVDLESGDVLHWLRIEGVVAELYDVAVLPGTRRPMLLGLKGDEICRTFVVGEAGRI